MIIDHGRAIATGTPGELKARAGRDRVEIRVRHAADLAAATPVLANIGSEEPASTSPTGGSPSASTRHERLADAVRALDDAGIDIDDVGLRRPTLDEVFLALTGRYGQTSGADDPPRPFTVLRIRSRSPDDDMTPP